MSDINKWFDRLAAVLKGRKLPCQFGPARECEANEFMFMHLEDGAAHFKHNDTRNYVRVSRVGDAYELELPFTNQAFLLGYFDRLEKHKVWISFGSTHPTIPQLYEFDSESELNAFLKGVSEAEGYLNFEQFDTEEEMNEWMARKREDGCRNCGDVVTEDTYEGYCCEHCKNHAHGDPCPEGCSFCEDDSVP